MKNADWRMEGAGAFGPAAPCGAKCPAPIRESLVLHLLFFICHSSFVPMMYKLHIMSI